MTFWHLALPGVAATAGVAAWGALHPASQLFGPTIRRIPQERPGRTGRAGFGSTVALTFDDGPNPAVTPQLLKLLDQYGVRASFFLIGQYVRACPALAAEIAGCGHTLGNHTDTHPSLLWLSRRGIAEELNRCQEAIERATGYRAAWMRPPYGFRGPQLAGAVRQAGIGSVVMWSISAVDWKPQLPSAVVKRLRAVSGGDIVLLHDGDSHALGGDRSHTLAALEFWLPRWKDAGLRFVSLDAIGNDARAASRADLTTAS